MKNLSNSLSDIFAEKSVNFYGKMNFSFAKLPSFVISLRFGAFSWDQLPLKKPWICLIFEMLKSLHENWNCTAPPDKSKGCWNNTFWWLWCAREIRPSSSFYWSALRFINSSPFPHIFHTGHEYFLSFYKKQHFTVHQLSRVLNLYVF